MYRILLAAFLVLPAFHHLAAQPFGPERSVDPAVPHRNAAEVAPGVRLANGSLCYVQTDLQTAGRVMGLCMRRVWRSDMQFDGPLGQGWTCEYLQAAWRDTATGDIHWHDADGFLHTFVAFDEGYVAPPGVYVTAAWDDVTDTVRLRQANGTLLDFNDLGQLVAITDRHGNAITFSYDVNNRLELVTDDRGESWEFVHDNGRIAQLIDRVWETTTRDPRTIDYVYDDGLLVAVKLPETSRFNDAGSNRVTWEYTYDSGRLCAVTAPNEVLSVGPVAQEFEYDTQGRVVSFRDRTTAAWHLLRYTLDAEENPLVRHVDPRGVRVDYTLDAAGHAVRVEQFTGFWAVDEAEPIDHAYVVQSGASLRSSDPDSFITQRSYNAGHQLTWAANPAGDADEFDYPDPGFLARAEATAIAANVITVEDAGWEAGSFVGGYVRLGSNLGDFEFHEIGANTADTITVVGADLEALGWGAGALLRVFTQNPDPLAAGNLLAHRRVSSDTTAPDIVRSWSYEPYFQQVRSETSARGFTTFYEFEFETSGDPADGNLTRKLSPEVTILLPDGTSGAVTYETTFAYNVYGQLSELTDPEGAVQVRHYYASGDQRGFLQEVIRDYGGLDLTERFEYDKTGLLTGQYPPAAFDAGVEDEDFKTTWQVNELGQRWHETGRVVAQGERTQAYRYFDASGNEVRTFTSYVTAEGDAPAAPTDADDPNSFTKDTTAMAATWVEVARAFDQAGRITEETSDAIAGNPIETVTWTFEYDELGRQTARISPLLNTTGHEYDERGLTWRSIEGAGSAVESTYEHDYTANGLIAAKRTPLGHETVHAYDGYSRRVAITDPEGNARAFTLDESGNVTVESLIDAAEVELARTEWQYDEIERVNRRQRLAETAEGDPIGAGEESTLLTLDGRGAVVQRNDGAGRTWTYTFDGAGRMVTQVDPIGNELEFTRNAAGDPVAVEYSDWNQQTEEFENALWEADYNTLGLATTIRDRRHQTGFDTTVSFAWDGWGRLVVKTDATGVDVEYAYDVRSRPTGEQENPADVLLSQGASAEWDRDDRQVSRSVTGGTEVQLTAYAYDARNRLLSITRPDESAVTFDWDDDSRLAGWTDENGVEVEHGFDDRGSLVARTVTGATAGAEVETYEYDGAGRVVSAESLADTELLARTEWTWNTLHRPESHTLTLGDLNGGTLGTWTTTAGYDERGDIVFEGFSDETTIDYTLDTLSRVTVVGASSALADCLWAGPDRPVSLLLGNGTRTDLVYEAGNAGPVMRIQHIRDEEVLWATDRLHDLRGLPTRERRDHDGATGRAVTYDALRRPASVHVGADLAGAAFTATPTDFGLLVELELDLHGNRTELRELDPAEDLVYALPYVVSGDGMNRYTSVDGADFDYDDAGFVLEDEAGGTHYGWDFRGRMCAVSDANDLLRSVRYDAYGSRALEEEYDNQGLVRRTVLLNSPCGRPLEEIHLDGEGDELARVQYAHSPLGILADNSGGWRYHHRDQDGSLIGVTDDDGRRAVEFDYQPFGTPVRREVMLDVSAGEVTDVDEHTPILTSTRIHVSVTLTAGALAGRELAIAVPGASADRYRTAVVLTNGAGTIDVHDPQGLIADALINEGSGLLVYASESSIVTPVWTYNSLTDTSTFTVAGAGFSSWLLGGHLTPDVTRPAYLEIIEVDSLGNWLKVRGDARGMSGVGDHYRVLPPVGVDSEGGYSDIGERYLYRGYRHDRAPRLAGWPDVDWSNRSGTYASGGRTLDSRVGRWIAPAGTWRNPYAYSPWGTLDDVSASGAHGLHETWSPSPACPTRFLGQPPSRFAAPGLPG